MAIRLVYEPTDTDYTKLVPRGQSYTRRPSPFLASHPEYGELIHGNSKTRVLQDGEDISATCNTWRWMRVVKVQRAEAAPFNDLGLMMDWHDDNKTGNPNWMDIPGFQIPLDAEQKNEDWMMEFVIRPQRGASLSSLYFFVVVSTQFDQYRVRMSAAREVPTADWATIRSKGRPWAGGGALAFAIDSGWLIGPP